MNRRGHLGTLLLVFGAFILVGYALHAMLSFGGDISKIKAELRALSGKSVAVHKDVLINIEKMVFKAIASSTSVDFEKTFNECIKKLAEEKRASGLNMNVYAKLALGNYSLTFDSVTAKYTLVVNNVFEQTAVENNNVRYLYNLEILFDKSHVISVKSF